MPEMKTAQELLQWHVEGVVDQSLSRQGGAGLTAVDVEASRDIAITPWELSPSPPASPPAKSRSFSRLPFSRQGSQANLKIDSNRPSVASVSNNSQASQSQLMIPQLFPENQSSPSLPPKQIRKTKSSFFPNKLSSILPGRSKSKDLRVGTDDMEHPSLRPKTPPLPGKYFSPSERKYSQRSMSQPQSPTTDGGYIMLDTNLDDMGGIVDHSILAASGSTSPNSALDSSSYSHSLSDHSLSSYPTLHSISHSEFHNPFSADIPLPFTLEASKRHAMVDDTRKISPTTIVKKSTHVIIPPGGDGMSPWKPPESWEPLQEEVETPGHEGNSSEDDDFFSYRPPPVPHKWSFSDLTIQYGQIPTSRDGSETCVSGPSSGAEEFGKFKDYDQCSYVSAPGNRFPGKGSETKSLSSTYNGTPRPSKSSVSLKSFKLKIFRADNSFHVVDIGLSVTVAGLTEKLREKLLHGNDKIHKLYLVERGKERVLSPFEKPLQIVRRLLEMAGYDMRDGKQLLGHEGLSFLLKFVYKHQVLGATDQSLDIDDFERVDLSERSLRTIPIVLHQHADQIVSLYLSRNPMLEIPLDFIQSCTSLRDLRLSNMAMKKVPRSVQHCTTLNRLDISSNRIPDLEETFLDNITGLRTLLAQNNRLKDVPWHFPRLRSLVSLNLSNNKFENIPIHVCELENLRDLDVSFNLLYELPRDIGRLTNLEHFIMVGNQVTRIPNECSKLANLRRLDCRRNFIKDLSVISMLPKLEKLCADYNSLHEIGLSLGPNLSTIEAAHNEITQVSFIPGPMGKAPYSLVSLDISYAKLSSLDDLALGQLFSLRTLRLDHNSFKFLPESIGRLKWLETLTCSYNNIESIPAVIGKLQKLEVLEIHNNSLTEFPITLWNCESLRKINATSNLISAWHHPPLPSIIAGDPLSSTASRQYSERKASTTSQSSGNSYILLPPLARSLERLYLGENHITDDLLANVMLLKELKVLNLSFNEIQELPGSFFRSFSRLEELYLSGNKLMTIPAEDLPRLTHLTTLFLNGNKLQTLPQELGKVKSLTVLDVGSNLLKYNINNWEFDWNWNFNKSLKYLNLSGNKKLQIKSDVNMSGSRRHSRTFSLISQRALAGFSELAQLRVLGLMDVTIMTTDVSVDIPDEIMDRRVRTSESTVLGMAYGIADTLGKNGYLNMLDLVHAFPHRAGEAVFAMFGRSRPWKRFSNLSSGNRIPKFLHDNYIRVLRSQLEELNEKGTNLELKEGIPDALRRSFLKVNYELHNSLFSRKQADNEDPSVSRGAASGIVLYFVGKKMYVANAGDALAVVSRGGVARSVSTKHNPYEDSEISRIRLAEGWISPSGLVNGEADVSRSFGFFHLPYVINARPDVVEWELSELDEFVIVGTPNLWDYVSFQTAVDIARQEDDPMIAAQKLRDFALSYGADGTTMIMVISVADLFKTDESRTPKTSLVDTHIFKSLPRPPKDDITDRNVRRLQDPVPAPIGHLALVFTDIRNSTHLWDVNRGMNTAWRLHNNLLRRLLRFCGGYEVKTEGDAFMCAFSTTLAAVWWCLSVQTELLNENWPLELLECEDGKPITHPHDGRIIAAGISIRMGIHCGSPLCERDPVNHRMDYFGPMVNRTARINGHAAGGQIMCSADVMREIHAKVLNDGPQTAHSQYQPQQAIDSIRQIGLSHFPVGEIKLKGLELPEMISVIYPKPLAYRHEIQEYLAAPSDWTSSRVQFNVSQIRQLGMVCLRLEGLASRRIFREISERKASVQTAIDAEQGEEEEDPPYLYGDPGILLPGLNDKSSDRDMMLALDALSGRIENAAARLKEMIGHLKHQDSLKALQREGKLDERTLRTILDILEGL